GGTVAVRNRPEHPDTLFYGVDLYFDDGDLAVLQPNFEIGDMVNLTAKVRIRGNSTAKNVVVRFLDGNNQFGSDRVITEMNPADSFAVVNTNFTITRDYHAIYAFVDPDSLIGELDEKNNVVKLEIYTGKGSPLRNVQTFPNPFRDYMEFTYVLSKPMADLTIKVFTVRGRPVKTFDFCPSGDGYNSVGWDGRDNMGDPIANGTYIYKIIAEDSDGEKFEFTERLVRMR
ncbi:MAG TPA: hypothetical protein ENN07_03025, partial [candidate division Zixibacteria bacterium]|nr:hypothetical protein [candidate division Zixibacteria bacterium]